MDNFNPVPIPIPEITPEQLCELEADVKDSKVLVPGTTAYEDAIFIGNLLYRMQTPAAVVQVTSVRDVQATIRFARKYGVKTTVKNGGHSYAGFCLNRGGIVIDLREMNKVSVDTASMTISIQGGAIWKDAYDLLQNEATWKNMLIGGQCPGVGVSGFTLGGGLSPFSRSYGLGIDNLLEMTIVTADGEVVTVGKNSKEKHHQDLFWALRGGGGGNFGVTVEFKSKIHELKDKSNGYVCCGELGWKLPQESDNFRKMMQKFNDRRLPDELTVDAIWLFNEDQLMGQMTVLFNGPWEEYQKACRDMLDCKPSLNTVEQMHYTKWAIQQEGFDVNSLVYHHHASFIFPEGAITDEVTEKMNRLMIEAGEILKAHPDKHLVDGKFVQQPKSSAHLLWDHIGGASSCIGAEDTAFYWRDGHYVTTVKVQWTNESQALPWYEFTQKCKNELQCYAIEGKAAYLNYIDDTVLDWQEAYYGANYPRLQTVKKYWDPEQFWNFDMAIEGDVKRAKKEQNSMLPQPESRLPFRWTEIAVENPEPLYSATSAKELLVTQEKLRKQRSY